MVSVLRMRRWFVIQRMAGISESADDDLVEGAIRPALTAAAPYTLEK
jgi:hypothetical protein